jgi:hypothetical protein
VETFTQPSRPCASLMRAKVGPQPQHIVALGKSD